MLKGIKELAAILKLEHDGGDDRRLFGEMITANTLEMNKKEYGDMEKDLENFEVSGVGFKVSAWNDSSGYAYWKKQGEHNYIQITVYLDSKVKKVNASEIDKAVSFATNHFNKYSL